MMLKKIIFLLMLIPLSINLKAQTDSTYWKNMALEVASELELTFRDRNFKAYAQLNHPKLVEMMGTVDDFAQMMEEQMAQIEVEAKIDSIDFGVPFNFVKCEKSINCLLPQTLIMSVSDSLSLKSVVYLLGISEDSGNTWYFIDASNGEEFLDAIIPNRCKIFVIPKKEEEFIRTYKND